MKHVDVISGVIGVLIGAYVLIQCQSFPPDVVMKIGPAFFPEILAWGLVAFSALLVLQALLGKVSGTFERLSLRQKGTQRILLSVGVMIVYCAVLKPVGFILATIPFIIFFMFLLGNRNKFQYLWVPMAITIGVYLVFEKVLVLSLPNGLLDFIL
ncbi:MAG: tripartite tricarboxylate transporter TctB family protein [Deltaproteobacteria bacterium]|nr:tripartite tricarboxylate transporter TctB family protein [Deltaproteobacteria bacterium]